jgi:hypothetical protein
MMMAQAIDVAVRLTLFCLLIWPHLRLLAAMLEGPIWRSYGLTPRPHMMLMESVRKRRFTRALQFAAVVLVYDWIGQDMGGGQVTFWIAVGVVYSSTYWVTQVADWTLRFAARRKRALARAPRTHSSTSDAACGSDPIIMIDSKTGESFDCGSRREVWAWDVASNPQRKRNCADEYPLRGWMRSPS